MLQKRERFIQPFYAAVEVPEHKMLVLAAKADAQQPLATCSAAGAPVGGWTYAAVPL